MNKEEFKAYCHNYSPNIFSKPLIMGILNQTPDSFSDGGAYQSLSKAFDKAMRYVEEGADLIDIGGESSRPGAKPITLQEELDRVLPIIEKLRSETSVCLSIDTTKPAVMTEAARLGIGLINDIHALQEEGALDSVANLEVPVCLMHRQGSSENMQRAPHYKDIINTIRDFFSARIDACEKANISRNRIILDPGFGFGKTTRHNLMLIKNLAAFRSFNLPLLLGFSRKQSIGELLDKPVDERLIGGVVLTILSTQNGVNILRTHDVVATKEALTILDYYNQLRDKDTLVKEENNE